MTTITTLDSQLKEIYVGQEVESLTYQRRPLLAALPKMERFGGRNLPLPLRYGNGQGRSAAFATAQANVTATRYEAFLLTRVNDYAVATMDGESIEATRGDEMAFLETFTAEIDAHMETLAEAIETFLFRSGTGSIGQISTGSDVTTDTITLADINDIAAFEIGMTLVVSATDGGAVRTGSEVLEGVDRNLGTLTATSASWDTVITAIAADDSIFVAGDAANGGANVKISGLSAWIPATAPTSTAFFGVDRSVDTTRLGGQRITGTSGTVEEALIDAQSVAARESAEISDVFLNHIQSRTLKKELGSRIEYQYSPPKTANGASEARVSFRSVVLEGDTGPINVWSANKCEADVAWLLTMDTWKLYTLGPPVKFLDEDGLMVLRRASADGYELRLGFRGQLGCTAPGRNARVSLTVPS